ncbi:hypothetical protein [Aquimarina aggregata]|uniref:hypothetical protein n=1 Tax=Aquimarina aggregata TaxID=1642818 RepID=UPI0024927C8E|nr:hypothetical protein [Aquimarina aggregata]
MVIFIIFFLVHLYNSLKKNRNTLRKKHYRVLKNKILEKENRFNSTLAIQEKKINQLKKYNEQLFETIKKNKHEDIEKIKLKISALMNDLIIKKKRHSRV